MKQNIIFFTENDFVGKIKRTFENARVEYAWQILLDATHYPLSWGLNQSLQNVDWAFIIWPKQMDYSTGDTLRLVDRLHKQHIKVATVQEGPHWYFEDYSISSQMNFIQTILKTDLILCHNEFDVSYYKGMFGLPVEVLSTVMIPNLAEQYQSAKKENKVMLSGNLCQWYGGMRSYRVAEQFDVPIYAPGSGRKREYEEQIMHILPWTNWKNWMKNLSEFKYAVNMMPTVAAGTFSLNCAYFGIPCIGNEQLDTQRLCHPQLKVNVDNIIRAQELANELKEDARFYEMCSQSAREFYEKFFTEKCFIKKTSNILEAHS